MWLCSYISGLTMFFTMQACGSGRSFCRHVEPHLQPLSELWRYDIDLAARRVAGRRRLCGHVLEFPAVNPLYQGKQLSHSPCLSCTNNLPARSTQYKPLQQHRAFALPAKCIAFAERTFEINAVLLYRKQGPQRAPLRIAQHTRLAPFSLDHITGTLLPNNSQTIALLPGRRHRYVYAAAAPVPGVNSPQQALVRVDSAGGRVAAWHAGAHTYVGEPVLVPKAQCGVGGACSY